MESAEQIAPLLDIVVEAYRLCAITKSISMHITDNRLSKRTANGISRFEKHFKESLKVLGVEMLDFTGYAYDIGLPVHPINLEDFSADDHLIIDMMIEPVIKEYGTANILKPGIVALAKA